MPAISAADGVEPMCKLHLSFAGRPIVLETNAPKIADYVSDFLPLDANAKQGSGPAGIAATITLMVRDGEEAPCEDAPWFRARGHFAIARFTQADAFCLNLRTRKAFGSFSSRVAGEPHRWRNHIFPALLGILAPAIEVVPVHAACVAHRAGGVLLAASSGTGKSTLAVTLARRGYALLGDEWTYLAEVSGGIEAWSIPVSVKLLPDGQRFFPELSSYRPGISLNGEQAYEVDPKTCFGVSRDLRSGIEFIVLLKRQAERGCKIVPINTAEAMDHLGREIEPLPESLRGYYERQMELIRRLKNTTCFRVSFNDHPGAVAEKIDSALASTK